MINSRIKLIGSMLIILIIFGIFYYILLNHYLMEEYIDYEDDGFQIKISVVNPELRGGANKYMVYFIKGEDKNGSIDIARRYSDFDLVRIAMLNRWPGCFISSLPQKKMVGNMEAIFIEERRQGLEEFVVNIAKIKHLWYAEEFQILLRGSAEIQKAIAPLSKPTAAEIIQKYESKFTNLSGKQINTAVVSKINGFSQFLKKISNILKSFKEIATNSVAIRKNFNDQTYTLIQFMLPQYQKNCLKEYLPLDTPEDAFIFLNVKDSVMEENKKKFREFQIKSEFDSLFMGLKRQNREIEAFLEAIKIKQNYQVLKEKAREKIKDLQLDKQKVMAGKTSITSMIKSRSKEQSLKEIQNDIVKVQKQQSQYTLICDISTVLLAYLEIDKFKKLRESNYYALVKKMAILQVEYARLENEVWTTVCNKQFLNTIEL